MRSSMRRSIPPACSFPILQPIRRRSARRSAAPIASTGSARWGRRRRPCLRGGRIPLRGDPAPALGSDWDGFIVPTNDLCDAAHLPLYPGALAAAERGTRTGGDARNRAHLEGRVTSTASAVLDAIGYDPQTSGGLLAAVTAAAADRLVAAGVGFVDIGAVVEGPPGVEFRG